MGQWIEIARDLVSVGPGVIVEANPDRVSVYITNLSAPVLHITPIMPQGNSTGGLSLKKDYPQGFNWSIDGNLARCQWIVTDASGTDEMSVIESIYLDT